MEGGKLAHVMKHSCVLIVNIKLGSQSLGDGGSLSGWPHFKERASKSLRKAFLDCKIGMRLGEDLYLKWGRERICSNKFSKVNAWMKDRSGSYSQEEIRGEVQTTWGSSKTILVMPALYISLAESFPFW